eukprot:8502145-Pyramimonas_sp.AAC.1
MRRRRRRGRGAGDEPAHVQAQRTGLHVAELGAARCAPFGVRHDARAVSYTHLRAHETGAYL